MIGKDVPFALLQAIAELPERRCAHGLAGCRRPSSCTRRLFPGAGVHVQARADPRGRLRELAARADGALHEKVATELIRLASERIEEEVEQIAEHAEKGQA